MFKSLKAKVQPCITKAKPWAIWALKAAFIVITADTLSMALFEPTYDTGWFTGFLVSLVGSVVCKDTFKEDNNV